jgi:hypothetical protein
LRAGILFRRIAQKAKLLEDIEQHCVANPGICMKRAPAPGRAFKLSEASHCNSKADGLKDVIHGSRSRQCGRKMVP